jgi:hypothetical protein
LIIRTEPALVAVGGGFVFVGMSVFVTVVVAVGTGVSVAVGAMGVRVSVLVEEGVKVGNGVGPGKVGNGVNVAPPKLNKGVAVSAVPCVRKISGVGEMLGALRGRNKLNVTEQRQHITSKNMTGTSFAPVCPGWL